MAPVDFPESNLLYGPPEGMDDSQVQAIHAYVNQIKDGSLDGAQVVVTAWKPNETELAALNAGANVYLSVLGGLPPHYIATSFAEATNL